MCSIEIIIEIIYLFYCVFIILMIKLTRNEKLLLLSSCSWCIFSLILSVSKYR